MAELGSLSITKCDHVGKPLLTYPGALVYADDGKVTARCIWNSADSHDLGLFPLSLGDSMIETFYRYEWFNIFAIYHHMGRFKGWYCNIALPSWAIDDEIKWYDLALDLLVLPDGETIELDRAESEVMSLDEKTRDAANRAMDRLCCWVGERCEPFIL